MDISNARVVVTGGAGFIGSHLTDLLVAKGARVTVIDNMHSGYPANLAKSADHIELLEGDVRDADFVGRALKDKDVVFHLAANASVPNSVADPRYDFESNAVGTFNVLDAARTHEIQRVVFASSAAVYGEPQRVPVQETHPLLPCSFYGLSKLAGEREGLMFHKMFGLRFTAIRIFNTYGPRQRKYVMADLLRKLQQRQDHLEVLGDGSQVRDYCYVTDTAEAFVRAAESDDMVGDVYNIAGGNPISIRDLVDRILSTLELKDTEVTFTGQSWKGDITRLIADISKIRDAGFSPKVALPEGIGALVEWSHTSSL